MDLMQPMLQVISIWVGGGQVSSASLDDTVCIWAINKQEEEKPKVHTGRI